MQIKLDRLARNFYQDGFDILENNTDGITIHRLIERIIKQIDLNINECLDVIFSRNQKADVALAYDNAVANASIYDIIAEDRRKYPPGSFMDKRQKRTIKSVVSNKISKTSNQGTPGHKINKHSGYAEKTRIN